LWLSVEHTEGLCSKQGYSNHKIAVHFIVLNI
jgi:hypothetical protein